MSTCGDCRYFANAKPYLIDGRLYGCWQEGDCLRQGTLHPRTMSWGRCHLWRAVRAGKQKEKKEATSHD